MQCSSACLLVPRLQAASCQHRGLALRCGSDDGHCVFGDSGCRSSRLGEGAPVTAPHLALLATCAAVARRGGGTSAQGGRAPVRGSWAARRCAAAALTRKEPSRVRRVAVVGGTHGNEVGGYHVVRSFLRSPPFAQFPSLEIDAFVSNEKAVEMCTRYVDVDLNRSFSADLLGAPVRPGLYESQRAAEINERMGPRFSEGAADLCIDLHQTTSNFGDGIILVDTSAHAMLWRLHLCASLAARRASVAGAPPVRVVVQADFLDGLEQGWQRPAGSIDLPSKPFLPLVAKTDITFEIGPVAHGTLRSEAVSRARNLVLESLDWLERMNCGKLSPEESATKSLVVYVEGRTVDYPRAEDGSIAACIAPSLQDRDFELLRPGDPVFQDIVTGKMIPWDGEECWPVFINEASYTEKHIAFAVTYRQVVRLPAFDCDQDAQLCSIEGKEFLNIDREM